MIITEVCQTTKKGTFRGFYSSPVGEAGIKQEYHLCGHFDTEGQSLGWVVTWQNQCINAKSTTCWSGQIQFDPAIEDVVNSQIGC